MKQKLIALLKTLFASKGFNAKELEGFADLVIAHNTLTDESTDQDLQTAAEAAKPTADFVQSVASRQVTDVKKPNPNDPKPGPAPEPKPEPNPNETATEKLLREILEGQKAQAAELAKLKGEKVADTRRDLYQKSMKGAPEDYQKREMIKFDRMKFDSDEEFDQFMEDSKEFHADVIQEATNGDLGGERPAGGAGGNSAGKTKEASAAEVDAAVNAII